MGRWSCTLFVWMAITSGSLSARADEVLLLIDEAPAGELILAPVDLTAAVRWCKKAPGAADVATMTAAADGRPVPLQFVPAPDYDPDHRVAGTVVFRSTGTSPIQLKLQSQSAGGVPAEPWDGRVSTPAYVIEHDPKKLGGFPCRITFAGSGKVFDPPGWQDRAYHPDSGRFRLVDDPEATVRLVSSGPFCTVVQVRGRYLRVDGSPPPSEPEATYQWFYFRDRPLVYVTAVQRQKQPFAWREVHFLELHQSGDDFPGWAGGRPIQQGEFRGAQESLRFRDWAAMIDGRDSVAMLKSGQMLIYDSKGGYGPYLHAHGSLAWTQWSGIERRLAAWLRIATDDKPQAAIAAEAGRLPTQVAATVTVDRVRARIDSARAEMEGLEARQRQQAWWRVAAAERLEAQGRLDAAIQAADGEMPQAWKHVTAGQLGMILEESGEGVRLLELADAATNTSFLPPRPLPLFALTLRHADSKEDVPLNADAGWREARALLPAWEGIQIKWRRPKRDGLDGLSVIARVRPDHKGHALRWTLEVDNPHDAWIVRRVVFPQAAVGPLEPGGSVLFPRAAGEVQKDLWQRAFRYQGTYPSGWTSMQFAAAYSEQLDTGIYVATHDPLASTKDVLVESRPSEHSVVLSFDHPAPAMDTPNNDFTLSGEAVWQLVRGDWYDATSIYRNWVHREARWFPKLTDEGRPDTPQWMRQLPAWALASGKAESVVPQVKRFAEYLGVPVGVHWYNWHRIPFDNDYPHYFPPHEGFVQGVAELQRSDVYVMPYINGRLWDTRDEGNEDRHFSRVALPAATKDEEGKPYVETYGSKESDGSSVRLAAMCPTTDVWQDKVSEIVLRLMNECGVKGVYIDQVAAAQPRLCFDRSHGHPAGGGHWWTEAYWKLIENVRREMPPGHMLTTECNAEPYAHVFDGYLTWHWQYDGQVPAFPAVYGGSIQMFGRAYRGGPTKDLALRMKAGQQLVYGEQIGWINPGVISEKENAEFLRRVVRLRWQLRRYFYAGEMARPPKLVGEIPRVTADWQWSGEWPVTTDAVMAGAWALPREKRLVLLFTNVADEPVAAQLDFDAGNYPLEAVELGIRRITADGPGDRFTSSPVFQRDLTFPPRSAWAWEVTGQK